MDDKSLHLAMYPWFGMGHLTPYLCLANKLAAVGHKVSYFIPAKTIPRFQHFNLHRDLITFIPVTVPHVEGLPLGTETTADVPHPMHSHLMTAMDLTLPFIEATLRKIKPHFVLYDFPHWLPSVARPLGIKCIHYCVLSPAAVGYMSDYGRELVNDKWTEEELMKPPPGFPCSSIRLYPFECRGMAAAFNLEYGKGMLLAQRLSIAFTASDAIAFNTCVEMEGPYCDFLEKAFGKPLILAGPVLPEPPTTVLEEGWTSWLEGFKPKTVIYCSLGSEIVLKKDQFQELVLGLELTGLPFLAALKPPVGATTVEKALPEGFEERNKGKGLVHGRWSPQMQILRHPSVGCFATHCGAGSMTEGMVSECQLVLIPYVGDQGMNARLMARDLKIGVEVERGEEDGTLTKEAVCKAIKAVMDDSKFAKEVRENHSKLRAVLLREGLEDFYIDDFVKKLYGLLESSREA
ncbi:hypothetical protein RJ639_029375 [Escallonia herrerae]|uniref:Glycosyltransferase n=1 Tax=Escallonia herrerae TaxID=1293975 RepID=A0AA89BQI4_9ASTE|nr:hypothetical protein RJ639_029375 [Escallonia herrerae]